MRITVLSVGKLKERFYREAVSEYEKRLGRYCRLELLEVADEKTEEDLSDLMAEQIKAREAARLLPRIRPDCYCIALAIEGEKLDSVTFSRRLDRLAVSGNSDICFVIGGSLGLHPDVLRRADSLLSFSDMTFPHQLMRVILLEQIYRAFRISRGEPYHK